MMRGTALGCTCLTMLTFGAGAHADEPAGGGFTDRIVVTDTRREATLGTQAGNIASLDESVLEFVRADHISELLSRVSGVYLHRGSGQEHLTAIRSPILTGGAGAGSFLYLEDGVPMRAAGFSNVNGLFESVAELSGGLEVVRGPGSVLYGSNAVHGLINILTRAPSDTFEGTAEASAGSFGRYKGAVTLSDTIGAHGYFAGVHFLNEDGWRNDAGVDQQKVSLRWDYADDGIRVRTTVSAHNLNQETAGFVIGEDAYRNSALSRGNDDPEAFRDTRAIRIASRIEKDLGDGEMIAFTPYFRSNDMDFLLHFLPSEALEENGHSSVGLLTSYYRDFEAGHGLVAGVDLEYTDGFLREFQSIPTVFSFTQGLHYDFDVTSYLLAGYVQGEWQGTDQLRLIGGLRIEYTQYDYVNKTDDGVVGRFKRPADRDDSYVTVKPRVGAVYTFSDAATGYANYVRGSRAPQVTDLYRLQINQTIGDIEPETIDSGEVGLRGELYGIAYDLAAYYMFKRNFFFRDSDGFNVPDGRTQHTGVELQAVAPLTDFLDLAFSGTYARHTYKFDNEVAANSTEDIVSGNDVDSAPRVITNTRLILRPLDNLTAEAEWIHVGSYFTDGANTNSYPGHDLFNLRASLAVTDTAEVFASIRNVTNTDYAERADFAFGSERYFPGEDRAYAGGVRVRF